jgi:protein FAM50
LFNKAAGFNGPIFDYSAQPTKATPVADADPDPATFNPLARPGQSKELEGFGDDAALTKVVDRRWYERNKHIFPASVWEEYKPERDFSRVQRKDTEGNTFFFS